MNTHHYILNNIQLKLIALISMIIDHVCIILFPYSRPANMLSLTVGRIAMPVYCFLISEGFFHTRSKTKYCIRMLIFALISEPVFDLAKYKTLFYPQQQNVFFSLFFGVLMLCFIEKFSNSYSFINITQLSAVAIFMLGAWLLHFDYDFCAVAMIAVFYFMHRQRPIISSFAACTVTAFSYLTFGAYLAVIPISLYNGQYGASGKIIKYLFYIMYPLHLFIIYLIHMTTVL